MNILTRKVTMEAHMSRQISLLGGTAALVLVLSTGACNFSRPEVGTGSGADGPPMFDALPDRMYVADGDGAIGGQVCDAKEAVAANLPPDVLILLDRSGSMDNDINDKPCGGNTSGGCGAMSKWTIMTTALNQVVAATQGQVNWGLKFFGNGTGNSGNTACVVNAGASVPPAANNAATIAAMIAGTRPTTATPTTAAEMSAGTYLGTVMDANPKYILLATDGQPTCGAGGGGSAADDANAITAVGTVLTAGFPTFVVGIATTGMGTADATLNSMAIAGGVPQTNSTSSYYPVSSGAELMTAVTSIAKLVADCTFSIGATAPAGIQVIVDGTPVSMDPANGWTYGAGMTTIVLNGTLCQQFMAGTVKDVKAIIPCVIP